MTCTKRVIAAPEEEASTNQRDVVDVTPRDELIPLPLTEVSAPEALKVSDEETSPSEAQFEEAPPTGVQAEEAQEEAQTEEAQTEAVQAVEIQPDEVHSADTQPEIDTSEAQREGTPSTDGDADAEGEPDPDYVPSEDESGESSPATTDGTTLPVRPIEDDDDPFIVKNSANVPQEHDFAQEAQDDDHDSIASSSADKYVSRASTKIVTHSIFREPAVTNGVVEAFGPTEPTVEHEEPTASQETEVVASQESEPAASQETEQVASQDTEPVASRDIAVDENHDEGRPLKRKRRSPPTEKPTRLLRSRTAKSLDKGKALDVPVPKSKKGKGKGKQREESDDEDAASVASEASSGGSSAAAQEILIPESRASSRESSVVSNAPSAYSGLSQPSPTMIRTLFGNDDQPMLPLRHDGGILRHHHGARLFAPAAPVAPVAPVAPTPAPPPLAPQRHASKPPSNASEKSSRAVSAEPAPSQPAKRTHSLQSTLVSRPSVASTASSSSPVTRANCRYHTISIPRSGHGRRVHFAVPGCSLGNGELMKEEHIQDHGNVDSKDLDKLLPYVEELNLSSYLLGVLRQLVGVDLLRENEVYYLPKSGDNVKYKRRHAHPTQADTITRAQRESISARTMSSNTLGRSKDTAKASTAMPPPSQASVSTAGSSASHAGKLSQRGSAATSASFSGSDLSDLEDDEEDMPPPKRAKERHPEPGANADAEPKAQGAEGEPSEAPATNGNGSAPPKTAGRRLQPRRGRKLGPDMAAYKPDDGESDGSNEEEEVLPKKRKRARGRGLKRKGTDEKGDVPPEDEPSERPKRRRKAAPEVVEAAR